jgi:hypothetical protein
LKSFLKLWNFHFSSAQKKKFYVYSSHLSPLHPNHNKNPTW